MDGTKPIHCLKPEGDGSEWWGLDMTSRQHSTLLQTNHYPLYPEQGKKYNIRQILFQSEI